MSEASKVSSNVSTEKVVPKGPPLRPKKTILVTLNPNRVIEVVFNSANVGEPVTVEEVNRVIAGIRSGHQKYLRNFRSNQRLDQIKAAEQRMIKEGVVAQIVSPVASAILSQVK